MRIVFMGTPDFAVPSLEAIHRSRHEVVLVVTQPDRPKGRGLKPAPTEIKRKALELGLPVIEPVSLKTPEFHDLIAKARADLLVVVAFRILPDSLFPLAARGAVNLHGSLLPKYRGAAPIQWAVAAGESTTGVTIFKLDRLVDHGGVLAQASVDIGPEETAGELFVRLMDLGRDLLVRTLDDMDAGRLVPREQDHGLSSPAPKLKKEDGRLDWSQPARALHDRIRAFNPYPVCFTHAAPSGRVLRIHRSRVADGESIGPGRVAADADGFPLVGCGAGNLKLIEVQWEGKPRIGGRDFLNGIQDRSSLRLE